MLVIVFDQSLASVLETTESLLALLLLLLLGLTKLARE